MRISAISFKFALTIFMIGVFGFLLMQKVNVPCLENDALRQAASTTAQVAATMMGFLLAALAILASIANMRLLRNMQRTGHYQVLLARMLITSVYFFCALIFSMVAMVIPEFVYQPVEIGASLMLACSYALIDTTLKFSAVLFSLKPDTKNLE